MPTALATALVPWISNALIAIGLPSLAFGATVGAIALGASYLLLAGAAYLVSSALNPQQQRPDTPKPEDGKYSLKQSVPPLVYVLGKVKKAGDYAFLEERAGVAHHVIVWAAHHIQGFTEHWLHDQGVALDGSGNVTAPAHFDSQVNIQTRLGDDASTAYSDLVTDFPTIWTNDHRGDGLATVKMFVRSVPSDELQAVYPAGMPQYQAVGVLTDINLPAGVFTTTTGDIAHVSDSNANLRLLGAARAETTLTSVASVSGAAYDWDVVLNVADATNFAVGNVVKMWNIGPLVTLSGDNSILLRDRPLPNEIYYPHARIGAMSPGVGVATATFAAGATLSTHLAVNDLVHFQGQTNRIASIDDGTRTVTFDDNWAKGATNARNYWVTIRAVTSGTCTLASGTSDVLNFSNSITATHLNVGDLVLTRGQAHEIIAINSAAQVQLAHAATFTGGAPYSIVTPGCVHEGGHVVTAVAGNQVTVKNRSRIKPPVNRVTAGEVIAIRTVLHQTGTGDGILPQQGGVLAEINRIALRGNNSSTGSHGIAGNGRLAIGPTQNGTVSNFTMGYDTAVIEFGRNYYGTYGCTLNARGTMWSGARQYGVWADIGSTVNLRHAVANGCHSDGFLFGPGAVGKVTESRGVANGDDGFHLLNGAIMYGEIPFAWGNASMGFRNQGGHLHCNEGGSICNLDAIYVLGTKNGGSGTNMLLLGSRREAVEVDDGVFDVSGSWISGSSGSAGSGRPIAATNGSWVKAISCGVGGNKAAPIASVGSRIDLSDMNPVLAVAGVTRLNEFTAGGSIILDGAATATGFNALKVGGGSSLTFFKIATLAHDFPSIGAGATATQTVTVTGATVGMGVLVASNAVSAGITYYGYVSAADTVTIVAENNSGGSIDPGNATHTVFVVGGTV